MIEPDLEDLHQLRSWVYSRAKLWWGFGVTLGYLAIVAVPVAWLVVGQEYTGPLVAVSLAILGRVCIWKSESHRKDAEWTNRAVEFYRGIGLEVDATKLADLRSKYSRKQRSQSDSVNNDEYYEASGIPSPSLLIEMARESAWWTEQLAKKASKLVFLIMSVLVLGTVLTIAVGGLEVGDETATTILSEIFRRAYWLAIFFMILLDTLSLGLKYNQLGVAAKESMEKLTALLDRVDEQSVPKLMTTVSDYQSARKEGPPIPDWFMRYHANSLQRVWDGTLSMSGESDSRSDRNP